MTSKHKSTYNVKGGVYDWAVVPSVQPELADFPIPESPYTITASANGRYSDKKDVMVKDYKQVVNNQNFDLPPALSTNFVFKPGMDVKNDVTVLFNAYNKNGTPFIGKVSALVNDIGISVDDVTTSVSSGFISLSTVAAGLYTLTFNPAALGISTIYDADLTLSIDTADDYTPLTFSGKSLLEQPQVNVPYVIDAEAAPYADGGATFVSGTVDVFILPEADTTYYYKIGVSKNILEAYYQGETGNPSGSYFDGSLIEGDLVFVLGESLDYVSGTLVSGNRITVPGIPGQGAVLEVIAYKDGVASEVFTHDYRCAEPTGVLILGTYNAGNYLAAVSTIGFKPTGVMDIDYNDYPLGEYYYKIFCWNEDYVPLFAALAIK